MYNLLDKTVREIPRFNLMTCLHMILLGTDIQVCHNGLTEIVLQRFHKELPKMRLKELERVSFVMGLYNFESKSGIERVLGEAILKELKNRIPEIIQYPRCLPACLHYLTLRGHHDAELISSVLDPNFIDRAYGKNRTLGREIFALDCFTKINLKNVYTGHSLTEKRLREMGKFFCHYIPSRDSGYKLNNSDRILVELAETINQIYTHSHMAHVLPHYERPGKFSFV